VAKIKGFTVLEHCHNCQYWIDCCLLLPLAISCYASSIRQHFSILWHL